MNNSDIINQWKRGFDEEKQTDLLAPYKNNMVLAGYMGSLSHGVYDDKLGIDDIDIMSVVIPSKEQLLGLQSFGSRETVEVKKDEFDIVLYSIKKFVGLLLKANPNVVGLLWLKKGNYLNISEAGQRLIGARTLFSSKLIYKSFTGYAYDQLNKMTRFKFEGYMGDKRKKLVEKFGYDTKNAAHCIRLLRMGIEFLKTGELNVWREDREVLYEIKRGGWKIEQVHEEAMKLFREAELALVESKLPDFPDSTRGEQLLIDIQHSNLIQS